MIVTVLMMGFLMMGGFSTASGQQDPKPGVDTRKDSSGEYRSELIQKGLWRIQDMGGSSPCDDMYLFEGDGKAVLIDAGMGKGDLARYVRGLTALPIEIAVTHGHGDHIGQINQFSDSAVYISEKEKALIPAALLAAKIRWVKDGDRIDLGGGRALEVFEVPGHTAGSIMFLERCLGVLAVGDAVGSGSYVWKFTDPSPLTEYRDTLRRLELRLADHKSLVFLTGHHWQERTPLTGKAGIRMVSDLRMLCEKIISGEVVGTPASLNMGSRKISVLKADYGLAGIWYDPVGISGRPGKTGEFPAKGKIQ